MARSRRLEVVFAGDAKGALTSMTAVERKAGGLGSTMAGLGTAAAAAGVAIGAAAVGAGIALYGIGSSFDSAYDTIRVRTGQTGQRLGELQQSFRNVVRTVPTDFGTASDAIAGLNQRLGLTGHPLEAVSRRVIELSRLTETDLGTNVQNLTRVFGDWGVQAADMPDTLDMVFRATQQSGVGLDQLSAQVVQFGAPLRNLGFSFEDSVAMLSQFEAQGVNTTTVMSGLRQGLKNFAAAGEEPADAFRRFVDGVQNGTLDMTDAMSTFGARAGADMFAAIREGRFDFDQLSASIANGSDTIMGASRDTRDFGEQWQLIKNRVMLALEPVATRVFAAVGDGMTRLGPIVGRLGDWLTRTLPPAMAVIEAKVREVWPQVLAAFETVRAWVQQHWPEISQVIREAMDTVTGLVSGAVDVVMTLWNNFGNNILDTVRRNFGPIQEMVRGVLQTVRGVIHTVTALIHGDWSGVWNGIKETFAGVWHSIFGYVQMYTNSIRMWIGVALETIGSVVKGALRPIGRFFSSTWRGIAAAVAAAWAAIRSNTVSQLTAISGIISGIVRGVRAYWSTSWAQFRSIITGVWRAIRGAVSGGMDFIETAVRGGVTAIRTVWGGIRKAFEVPINWVLDRVVNPFLRTMRQVADVVNLGGIIPGPVGLLGSGATSFHSGGVVGETGGRAHSGPLRPGEVPAVLQLGETVVDRRGMVAGRPAADVLAERYGIRSDTELRALGLPIGGLPNPVSAITGLASDAVHSVAQRLRDLAAGGLRRLLDPIRDAISDAGGRFGTPGRIFAGMVSKPLDALLMWVAGASNQADARDVPASFGPGMIWQQLLNVVRHQFPFVELLSGFRPGAITATGRQSLHSLGRAIDITPSMEIFNWLAERYPNSGELIFSPAGDRQIYKGHPHYYGEPTRSDHFDHIHWGWFDRGGFLQPGLTLAYNGTGKPEPVGHHLIGGTVELHFHADVAVAGSVLAERDLVEALDSALRKGVRAHELERLIRQVTG